MKKKDKEFKPEIKNKSENEYNLEQLKAISNQLNEYEKEDNNDTNTYFRGVLDNLMNDKNISLKTEYLDVMENFSGAKLEFFAKYANMPYLKEFIKIFETKRVSLERKSRKEIIMTLEKREQEMRMNNMLQMSSQFGYR